MQLPLANASPAAGDDPVVARTWPRTPRSVGRARQQLRGVLDSWELDELAGVATLVLSELMTNSVLHARVKGRLVETRIIRRGDTVRIEVHDASELRPEVGKAAEEDEQGRGLALVDELTGGQWGVDARQGVGKLVWAHVGMGVESIV